MDIHEQLKKYLHKIQNDTSKKYFRSFLTLMLEKIARDTQWLKRGNGFWEITSQGKKVIDSFIDSLSVDEAIRIYQNLTS